MSLSLSKKLIVLIAVFLAVDTLFLSFFCKIAQAEKSSSISTKFRSSESFGATKISEKQKSQFNKFKTAPIAATDVEKKQTIAAANDSGLPALRRQPEPGEETFEPKRIPLKIPVYQQPYRTSPNITIINPSGYGASWGNAGIGIGFQERVRFRDASDGVIGLGIGLGNPRKNVGVQLGLSLVDVSAPFRDGTFNLKLHRRLPEGFSLSAGVQGLATWGDTDGGSSGYGSVTKRFLLRQDRNKLFSEIYTTVGLGGGQFRSEFDIDNGIDSVGVFGSLGVKVIEPVNLVTEWTGQDLTIGVPFVPFRSLPMVIVPAVTDITGTAGDGARFILGVGYTVSF